MRRPIYLLPFIIVYKIIFGVFKVLVNLCRYFYLGLKFIFSVGSISKSKEKTVGASLDISVASTSNKFDLKKFNNLRKLKEKELKKLKEKDRIKEINKNKPKKENENAKKKNKKEKEVLRRIS